MRNGYRQPMRSVTINILAAIILPALFLTAQSAKAEAQSDPNLPANVLQVFRQKCAACHSPQAKKIKKFGTITDLPKLAANHKLVTPGDSAHSKLWTSIDDGDMPPDDSPTGPLTERQKQIVRQWIDMRTPTELPAASLARLASDRFEATSSAGMAAEPMGSDGAAKPPPFGRRLARWLGKFHPLAVHFPIALLMAAALAEALWLRTRHSWLTGVVRFCLVLGTLGALGAGALGWINASFHTPSELLTTHRWLGTLAVLWAIPLAALCELRARRSARTPDHDWAGRSRLAFQIALFAGVALFGIAAHMGGALVYGADYLKF